MSLTENPNDLIETKPIVLPLKNEKRQTRIENGKGVQNFDAYFRANIEQIQDPETKAKDEEKQRQDRIKLNTQKIEQLKLQVKTTIDNLDQNLQNVVEKQEADYLQGYQQFVNKKTQELKKIVEMLNEKNAATSLKDDKILELEMLIYQLRAEAIRCEDINNVKDE